jgi:hypothetical protein
MPIYYVQNILNQTAVLVNALNRAAAVRRASEQVFKVDTVTATEVIDLISKGVPVLAEPEQDDGDDHADA